MAAASLAIAMLTAGFSDCPDMVTTAIAESGPTTGEMHDCGDPKPATPTPTRHDCQMLASCASVALSTHLSTDIGGRLPSVRPVARNDARPSDVIPALVAPPPRA